MCMQYTLRNIPEILDAALRRRARQQGRSLNDVAVEALINGAGLSDVRPRRRALSNVAGSWREDPTFDRALAEQDTVDEDAWK